jgi:hypothetical protein
MSIITDKFKSQADKIVRLPLWDRWPVEALRSRCNDIGIKAFNRGYRHEAITESDLTFSHFWKIKKVGFDMDVVSMTWPKFCGIDISSDSRPGSVIFTLAVSPDGRRYPCDLRIGDWKSPQFVAEIINCYHQFHHQVIFVENNGVQTMLVDWLNEKGIYLPVQGYLTGRQKMSPEIGLPSMDVEFENDSWFFPMDVVAGHVTQECQCNWCRFIREFEGHPQYATSDVVMAVWFAREAVRQYWGRGFVVESPPFEEGVFEF